MGKKNYILRTTLTSSDIIFSNKLLINTQLFLWQAVPDVFIKLPYVIGYLMNMTTTLGTRVINDKHTMRQPFVSYNRKRSQHEQSEILWTLMFSTSSIFIRKWNNILEVSINTKEQDWSFILWTFSSFTILHNSKV